MNLVDICFYVFVFVVSAWLLWELIPDGFKEYWKYTRQLKQDHRKKRRGKYSFTWRIGRW